METFIGCSGYYYNHWKGIFYPDGLPKKQWLIYYSSHFSTVEINNTFYRMPQEKAVKNWYAITPASFMFAVKGYRYITHIKKLIIDDDLNRYLNEFQKLSGLLKEKSGPLLWQFPAKFTANPDRLKKFCSLLSREFIHVFEFRNESWFNDEIYSILDTYGCSLCIVSGPASVPRVIKTGKDTAYIRFHGEGSWYRDNYSNESLRSWKNALDKTNARRLFAYFNNDMNAFAVNNGKYFASLY